jgi:aromatic-L-amino-acid decarboxylase
MTGNLGNTVPLLDDEEVIDSPSSFNITDYSCELTRSNRGFPMWVFMKVFGTKFLCDLFEEKLALAQYFHEHISQIEGIIVGPPPMLCNVIFWYSMPGLEIIASSRRFNDELQKDKRVFLSPMPIDGKIALRFCVGCFRSHQEHVDLCIRVIRKTAATLRTSPDIDQNDPNKPFYAPI